MSQTHSNTFQDHSLTAGTILQSRYRIVGQLGRGGMGTVYEAIDLRLGHTVAVKQTQTANPELWKQFEREARLMAGLNHPALPRVSDYFTEAHRAFLVMQHIDGHDLAETLVQQPGPLPKHVVIAWADQLLDALVYLHSHDRQIVHRDIKPHNLKITETGRIALLDFGLAKSQGADCEEDETGRSIFGYSPRYAPLEQIQDLGTTPQSDIYALGATLYHLLTGVKPPDALGRATAIIGSHPDPLKPACEVNPGIGNELSLILDCAMAQNPAERYSSAADFRDALRRLGRIDAFEGLEFVSHPKCGDANVVGGDTTLIAGVRASATSRLGLHAIAAVFVILLTAFGAFCRYYQWRMPVIAFDANAAESSLKSVLQAADSSPSGINSSLRNGKYRRAQSQSK